MDKSREQNAPNGVAKPADEPLKAGPKQQQPQQQQPKHSEPNKGESQRK